jgi:lipoprotein Spr
MPQSLTGSKKGNSAERSLTNNALSNSNESIEFLENIAVKPGKIVVTKPSDAVGIALASKNEAAAFDKMPEGLSEVEKANWLQLKYSIKMDVAVEEINNIPLLKKIDEWWGTPYCLGGTSRNCIDCSYFTWDVMKDTYHINLKRTAAEQYEQSKKIEWSELKEGDLIFFKLDGRRSISHVGIYLTNNKFVHASTSQGVTISDLAEPYWQKRLYSLGRVPLSASVPN